MHPAAPTDLDRPAPVVPSAHSRAIAWGSAIAALATVITVAAVFLFDVVAAESVTAVAPTSADERAVVATVRSFTDAWREQNCAAYLEITTQVEQERAGIADCASFDARSAAFTEIVGNIELVVTEINDPRHEYTVTTRERFLVERDTEGNRLSKPQHVTVDYTYRVVPHDDHWAILWWFDDAFCDAWSPILTTPGGATCEPPGSD